MAEFEKTLQKKHIFVVSFFIHPDYFRYKKHSSLVLRTDNKKWRSIAYESTTLYV
jgi:hypothetical protein